MQASALLVGRIPAGAGRPPKCPSATWLLLLLLPQEALSKRASGGKMPIDSRVSDRATFGAGGSTRRDTTRLVAEADAELGGASLRLGGGHGTGSGGAGWASKGGGGSGGGSHGQRLGIKKQWDPASMVADSITDGSSSWAQDKGAAAVAAAATTTTATTSKLGALQGAAVLQQPGQGAAAGAAAGAGFGAAATAIAGQGLGATANGAGTTASEPRAPAAKRGAGAAAGAAGANLGLFGGVAQQQQRQQPLGRQQTLGGQQTLTLQQQQGADEGSAGSGATGLGTGSDLTRIAMQVRPALGSLAQAAPLYPRGSRVQH